MADQITGAALAVAALVWLVVDCGAYLARCAND